MTNVIQTVDFHGQTLITISHDGKHYVGMKAIVKTSGLAGKDNMSASAAMWFCRKVSVSYGYLQTAASKTWFAYRWNT